MCPTGAISTSRADPPRPVFHPALCTSCAVCVAFCPQRAIELTPPPGTLPKHGRRTGLAATGATAS
jgi:ferredoxin